MRLGFIWFLAIATGPIARGAAGSADLPPGMEIRVAFDEEALGRDEDEKQELEPEVLLYHLCNQRPVWGGEGAPTAEGVRSAIATCRDLNKPLAEFFGQTPLFPACVHGHEFMVEALLEAGATPALQDEMGYTPLMAAAEKNHGPLALRVYHQGGQVTRDWRDTEGDTALAYAARAGHRRMVRLLLALGADAGHELARDDLSVAAKDIIQAEFDAYRAQLVTEEAS